MRLPIVFALLFFPSFLFAWEVQVLETPAPNGSGQPELAAFNGEVYLSWLQTTEGGHVLKFSKWNGEKWSIPAPIAAGVPFFVNWADFPSVLPVSETILAAHWLEKHEGGDSYSYDIKIGTSPDAGKNWSAAVMPHRDGKAAEHGFVSMFRLGSGELGAVWLDGRSKDMSLMFTTWKDGALGAEKIIDPRVCDCCQTAAASTTDGVLVFYRDRSNEELRDISYVRYANGKWSESRVLHNDGWKINACPVNGPAAAADGKNVAVVWFTAVGDKPQVLAAFSADSGASFSNPVRVDEGNPSGRVDLVILADGSALVAWMENTGAGAEIRVRRVRSTGTTDPAFSIAATSRARASGFPRMARFGEGALIAWTHSDDPPRVRVARIVP